MSDLAAAQRILRTTFGFEAFRPGQAEIVAAILDGRDVLAVMPTGSGKSLCYQLPALLRDGLTIVVSPLIALMRNQVAQLRGYGIAAAALNSANDPTENRAVLDRIARGELRLVYVAPERLVRPDTLDLLKRAKVTLLAVDEAHCISQWGHDFRPEYAALGTVQAALGGVQTVAFTATADAATRTDILGEAVQPRAGRVRARLRSAQSAAGDAGESRRPQAGRGFRHGASRAKRHRLLQLAAQDRSARGISARQRRQGAGLSRRHGTAGALAPSGYFPAGGRRRRGGDRGVRHGHRQARCALRSARRHAGQYRKLLPGDRPRRPRRPARRHADALRHGRYPLAPHADRRERRDRRAEAGRPATAQRAGVALRVAALPAADAAVLFRRNHAAVRPLRFLLRRRRSDRRHDRGAESAVGHRAHRPAFRHRASDQCADRRNQRGGRKNSATIACRPSASARNTASRNGARSSGSFTAPASWRSTSPVTAPGR